MSAPESEKTITRAAPVMLQPQKAMPGRSPPNRAAKVAVISGSTPSTTPPWDAGTVCMATLEKPGKP